MGYIINFSPFLSKKGKTRWKMGWADFSLNPQILIPPNWEEKCKQNIREKENYYFNPLKN